MHDEQVRAKKNIKATATYKVMIGCILIGYALLIILVICHSAPLVV